MKQRRSGATFKRWVWTDSDTHGPRSGRERAASDSTASRAAPSCSTGSRRSCLASACAGFAPASGCALRSGARDPEPAATCPAHTVGAGRAVEMIFPGLWSSGGFGRDKEARVRGARPRRQAVRRRGCMGCPWRAARNAQNGENFSAGRKGHHRYRRPWNNPNAIIITHSAFKRIRRNGGVLWPPFATRSSPTGSRNCPAWLTIQGRAFVALSFGKQIEAVSQRFDSIVNASGEIVSCSSEGHRRRTSSMRMGRTPSGAGLSPAQSIKGIDPDGSQAAMDMYVRRDLSDLDRTVVLYSHQERRSRTRWANCSTHHCGFFSGRMDRAGISGISIPGRETVRRGWPWHQMRLGSTELIRTLRQVRQRYRN